ncbi:DUF5719 family protein [Georgenia sp. MJ206]|uniref:DUF5719 family protein n=1 Tax=Georgenia wangjunii TaxID=3117730 RepID=UPI002F268931
MADAATPRTADASRGHRRGAHVARRVATVVSGLVLLGAVAGITVAGEEWPPAEAELVPARTVDVPAAPVAQVCPGPPVLATAAAGEDLDYDEFDPDGAGTTSQVDVLTLGRDGGAPAEARWLSSPDGDAPVELERVGDLHRLTTTDVTGPGVLAADPADDRAALAAGASVSRTDTGDLRGLFAGPCLSPGTTSWLVGGSTEPGSSAQLVLVNVGDTPATVEVSAWGSTGVLDTSGAGNVLVPPHGQEVVLLEAQAPAEPRLAVRVRATGGEVSAYVQDAQLRGLVPAGAAAVVPTVEPATDVHIPGVQLVESTLTDVDPAVVRILNPGDEDATLSVSLLGPDGEETVPGAEDLVVDPGSVAEVSLAGLPAGTWTVAVTSDRPVTAGALLTRVGTAAEGDGEAPLDRAWAPAVGPLETGVVVVPGLGATVDTATLALGNASDEARDVVLRPMTADGEAADDVALTVPARSGLDVDVAGLAEVDVLAVQVLVDGADGLHVAAVLDAASDDGALIAVVPLTEDPDAAQSITLSARSPALR